jgi:hypothetical protein
VAPSGCQRRPAGRPWQEEGDDVGVPIGLVFDANDEFCLV